MIRSNKKKRLTVKILEKYLNRNLTCPALWTPGDWSPSCCGHPGCSCCGCSASTSPSRPFSNMISIYDHDQELGITVCDLVMG